MTITAFGDITSVQAAYLYPKMLDHVMPTQILNRFGQLIPIPLNKTQTIKAERLVPYDHLTTPLQEGVTPSIKGTSIEIVTGTLQQWGDVRGATDVFLDTHELGGMILDKIGKLTGEQAGKTAEQLTYNVLKGGTAVYYANGAARTDVNTPISLSKQRAVVRALRAADAKPITEVLSASPNIGTAPIEEAYVAIGHTDLESDIRNLAGFIPVAEYGSRKPLCAQEIGSVENVRYLLHKDMSPIEDAGGLDGNVVESTTGTNADVYPIIYLGQDAFAVTPLKNQQIGEDHNLAVSPIVIQAKPSASDPLGQRALVGWKAWFTAFRLNETWMARLEVAATAL